MKLLRYGPKGREKPGILDKDGKIRDLSAHVPDIAGTALLPDSLKKLAAYAPDELEVEPHILVVALVLGTALVVGGVFALLLVFSARDDAGVGDPETRHPHHPQLRVDHAAHAAGRGRVIHGLRNTLDEGHDLVVGVSVRHAERPAQDLLQRLLLGDLERRAFGGDDTLDGGGGADSLDKHAE